ncbi:hypothetical protein AK830_g23 [Neonectria ditissima]|uniref:Heterokaryon incompatibility domain-containing protein n=1 Tax=Neonectria ditissima TaxID=78410 RepID=A0A0P7BH84_9HYPO|nr:hypothetical protein AK830_g23 [Neonectria ditissima]
MEQQAVLFQYIPLSGPRMIRVLVLEPAWKRSDPIRCSFEEISLDHDKKDLAFDFEALSYTWGVPRGTQPIFCQGRTVLVTPNCEQAILHIRRRSKARRIWIDAICINQQSIEEKNQQVPLMGEIYHGATRTIIWLGPNSDPELFKVLRHAARYGHAINEMKRAYRKVWKSQDSDFVYESSWQAPILSITESEKLAELCSNAWFSRIWTIQEFLLAKSAIFLMGDLECPTLALYTYYSLGKGLVKRADLEHYRMRNTLAEFPQDLTRLYSFQSFMNAIIRLAAQNNATDPLDKVFGMEAFLKSKLSELQLPNIDYASSLQQAYEEFTLFLIGTTASLWAFDFLGTPKSQPNDLPSWVIDLREPDRLAPNWTSSIHGRLPESDYESSALALSMPGKLPVRAKEIAKVARTSSRMPCWDSQSIKTTAKLMDDARTSCLSEWTAFAMDIDMHEDHMCSPYRFHSSTKQRQMFQQYTTDGTLCEEPNTRALESFTNELDYLRLRHRPDDDISIHSGPFSDSKSRQKRRAKRLRKKKKKAARDSSAFDDKPRVHDMCMLFLMSTGHLAESPGDLHEGDGVFIVEGSSYALVLRHYCRNEYTLIGKADIYDIEREKPWQPGKLVDDPETRNIILV